MRDREAFNTKFRHDVALSLRRGTIYLVCFVYIVRCKDGSLYTGTARDPIARQRAHNSGRGARYTSGRRPVRLVYTEVCASVGDALRRERALKRLSRAQKVALITRSRRRTRARGQGGTRCPVLTTPAGEPSTGPYSS